MKYKMKKRSNPQNRTQSKWYASPVYDGRVNKADLAVEVVSISSLSRGDVTSVIENLIDVIPKYLLMGKSVNLGELGTFRLSFTSEGVDEPGTFTVHKIRGARVIFTPSTKIRKIFADMTYEKSE
jgi:predicted histone-like DNA-binding protein